MKTLLVLGLLLWLQLTNPYVSSATCKSVVITWDDPLPSDIMPGLVYVRKLDTGRIDTITLHVLRQTPDQSVFWASLSSIPDPENWIIHNAYVYSTDQGGTIYWVDNAPYEISCNHIWLPLISLLDF